MRAAIAVLVVALLPATALATGTIGVYFTYNPGQMVYSPGPMEMFDGYIYLHDSQCDLIGGAELKIELPPSIGLISFILPEGGQVVTESGGNSFIYASYMNGISPGYNLLCTLRLIATDWCSTNGGTLIDAPIRIAPHEKTGKIQIACMTTPAIEPIEAQGLTSILCPQSVGTKSESWGAIKSLF